MPKPKTCPLFWAAQIAAGNAAPGAANCRDDAACLGSDCAHWDEVLGKCAEVVQAPGKPYYPRPAY